MKVAIQTYSVRQHMAKDSAGTLRALAEMGFKNWETCMLFGSDADWNFGLGMPPKEGKKFIDDLGVKIVGCHLGPDVMKDEARLTEFLDYQAAVGCWSPGLAADHYHDADDVKKRCELFNHVGELCRERGMVFHYHNHFHEFQIFDGQYVMDIILENTDPELVVMELDTFWAARGGADPVAFMKKYGKRVIMLHQKDFPKDYPEDLNLFTAGRIHMDEYMNFPGASLGHEQFAEIGTGVLPIQEYIDAGNACGAKYITLEQDFTKYDELESVQMSYNNFKAYNGIEWE